MKLKLTKGRVETFIEYIDPLANRALLDDFRHDWLAMEAEVERLSKATERIDQIKASSRYETENDAFGRQVRYLLRGWEKQDRERMEKPEKGEESEPAITLAEEIANDQVALEIERDSL